MIVGLAMALLLLVFCAGCLVGQASAQMTERWLARHGWRAWHLGRLYPWPPSPEQIQAAHRREREAREEKSSPPRPYRLS